MAYYSMMDMITWSPERRRFYEIYGYDMGPQIGSPMDAMRDPVFPEGHQYDIEVDGQTRSYNFDNQLSPSGMEAFREREGIIPSPSPWTIREISAGHDRYPREPKVKEVITETDDDQPNKKVTTIDYSDSKSRVAGPIMDSPTGIHPTDVPQSYQFEKQHDIPRDIYSAGLNLPQEPMGPFNYASQELPLGPMRTVESGIPGIGIVQGAEVPGPESLNPNDYSNQQLYDRMASRLQEFGKFGVDPLVTEARVGQDFGGNLPYETGGATQSAIPPTGYNYEQRVVDGPESPEMGHHTSFAQEFGGNLPSEGFQLDRGLQGGMLGDIEAMSSERGYLAESPEDISETFLPVDPLELHSGGQFSVQDTHDQRIEDAVMEDFPSGVLFTDPITGTEVTIGDIAMLVPLATLPSAIRAAGGIAAWVARNKGLISEVVNSKAQASAKETSRLTGMATRQPARETSRLTGLASRQPERDTSFLTGIPMRQTARDTSRLSGMPTRQAARETSFLTGMPARQAARDTSRLTGVPTRQPARDTSRLTGLLARQPERDTSFLTGIPARQAARDTSRLAGIPTRQTARETSRLTGLPARQTARDTSRLEGFSKGPPRLPPSGGVAGSGARDTSRLAGLMKGHDRTGWGRAVIAGEGEEELIKEATEVLETDLVTDEDVEKVVIATGSPDLDVDRIWDKYPQDIDSREERYLNALNEMYKKISILNVIAHLTGTESQAPLFMQLAAEKFKTLEGFRGERRLAKIAKGVYYKQNADGTFTWDPPKSQLDAYNRAMQFKASQREAKIISGYEPEAAKEETTADIRNLNFYKGLLNSEDPMAPLFAKAANLEEDDAGSMSLTAAINAFLDPSKLAMFKASLKLAGVTDKQAETIINNMAKIITQSNLGDGAPQQEEAGTSGGGSEQIIITKT